MLPSLVGGGGEEGGAGGGISHGQGYHRTPSSSPPSKSSSTSSSSPSPFSPYTRTMEEVWKDINLSSLHHHPPPPPHLRHPTSSSAATPTFRSIILQDFLNTTTRPTPSTTSPAVDPPSFYGCPPPTPPPPPPATVLSLNSTPEFRFLDTPQADHHHLQSLPVPNFNAPFDAFASTPFLSSFGKKRFPEEAENGTVDRRHKRMIKNRESAARSRARKQEFFSPFSLQLTSV
ncbi:hypothetical protein Ancab_026643 [Ancistrocladus abbreviatus]